MFYWDWQCQDLFYALKLSLLIVSVLGSAEGNYCITRRELSAVVKAVSYFETYLCGEEFSIKPTMLHFFGCVGELHPWHK